MSVFDNYECDGQMTFADIEEWNMTYKRSKTDSALYCPYCGRSFTMNSERYYASHRAREKEGIWAMALTSCKSCGKEFLFRNITPATVKKYGIKAVMKINEVNPWT